MNTTATKIFGCAVGLLLIAGSLGYVSYSGNAVTWYKVLSERFVGVTKTATNIVESAQPLRGPLEGTSAYQTSGGVVAETNKHRAKEGLEPLRTNARLNASAREKLDDLFARQYFAHESPTGEGPSVLIDEQGYEYITVAENLALGNYENDKVLVQAWMDSPGHRANIMNGEFEEIGVAVAKGTFDGSPVWIAVQHFGKPLSSCPAPDASLKRSIDRRQVQLDQMSVEIEEQKAELEEAKAQADPAYSQKVDEYNEFVESYNAILSQLRVDLEIYNEGVAEFNACAHVEEE